MATKDGASFPVWIGTPFSPTLNVHNGRFLNRFGRRPSRRRRRSEVPVFLNRFWSTAIATRRSEVPVSGEWIARRDSSISLAAVSSAIPSRRSNLRGLLREEKLLLFQGLGGWGRIFQENPRTEQADNHPPRCRPLFQFRYAKQRQAYITSVPVKEMWRTTAAV